MEECFLYRLQLVRGDLLRTGPTPSEGTKLQEHFDYLKNLTEQGTVILVGRTLNTDETAMGIVIFRANSPESAHEIMNNDPAVKKGVMTANLFPFRIALKEGE